MTSVKTKTITCECKTGPKIRALLFMQARMPHYFT